MLRSILALVALTAAAFAATVLPAQGSGIRNSNDMAYIELAELKGKIPDRDLLAALDDDQDGVIDAPVWAQIQSDVQIEIDGLLGQRYAVPFADPLPAVVKYGAQVIAIEAVYKRRGVLSDKSPEAIAAKNFRTKLSAIANGEEPLAPGKERARPSASAITEPSRTASDRPAI